MFRFWLEPDFHKKFDRERLDHKDMIVSIVFIIIGVGNIEKIYSSRSHVSLSEARFRFVIRIVVLVQNFVVVTSRRYSILQYENRLVVSFFIGVAPIVKYKRSTTKSALLISRSLTRSTSWSYLGRHIHLKGSSTPTREAISRGRILGAYSRQFYPYNEVHINILT